VTTAAPADTDWHDRAACRGLDTDLWFGQAHQIGTALKVCAGCPVRAECLHECLTHELPTYRYGVRGGLTAADRRRLPELPRAHADALAALRAHLATHQPPVERTDQPMTTPTAAAPTSAPELLTTSTLLRWAEDHPDPDVRDQGARAEAALTGLRRRYAADQELNAITTETEKLEKRLAELRAREAELAPPKKRSSPSYKAAEVRAWARANNIPVPNGGRIPKTVLDAWRAAGSSP
jgi:hypothetical protein